MTRASQLINIRFGLLTVIEKLSSGKNGTRWRCKCDCGNEIISTSGALNSKNSTSCGCKRAVRNNLSGLLTSSSHIGKKYGRLTVKDIVAETNKKDRKAECECECGKYVYPFLHLLVNGKVSSCGCLMKEQSSNRMKDDFHKIKIAATKRNKTILSGKFAGVSNNHGKFRAKHHNDYIGNFHTALEAAKAYDKFVFDKYGEPLILNFPEDYEQLD